MRAAEITETGSAVDERRTARERAAELSVLLLQEIDERERRILVLSVSFELEPHEIASLLGEAVESINEDLQRLEMRVRELTRTVSRVVDPPLGLS